MLKNEEIKANKEAHQALRLPLELLLVFTHKPTASPAPSADTPPSPQSDAPDTRREGVLDKHRESLRVCGSGDWTLEIHLVQLHLSEIHQLCGSGKKKHTQVQESFMILNDFKTPVQNTLYKTSYINLD